MFYPVERKTNLKEDSEEEGERESTKAKILCKAQNAPRTAMKQERKKENIATEKEE